MKNAQQQEENNSALAQYYKSRIGILEERVRQREVKIDQLRKTNQKLRAVQQISEKSFFKSSQQSTKPGKSAVISLQAYRSARLQD